MNTIQKLIIAAASVVAAGSVAQAQVMKAEVPFPFRAGYKVMAPGTYQVQIKGTGNKIVILTNFVTKQSAIVVPRVAATAVQGWRNGGDAILAFDCSTGRCELSRVWTGFQAPSMTVPQRGIGRDAVAPLTLIRLVRADAR